MTPRKESKGGTFRGKKKKRKRREDEAGTGRDGTSPRKRRRKRTSYDLLHEINNQYSEDESEKETITTNKWASVMTKKKDPDYTPTLRSEDEGSSSPSSSSSSESNNESDTESEPESEGEQSSASEASDDHSPKDSSDDSDDHQMETSRRKRKRSSREEGVPKKSVKRMREMEKEWEEMEKERKREKEREERKRRPQTAVKKVAKKVPEINVIDMDEEEDEDEEVGNRSFLKRRVLFNDSSSDSEVEEQPESEPQFLSHDDDANSLLSHVSNNASDHKDGTEEEKEEEPQSIAAPKMSNVQSEKVFFEVIDLSDDTEAETVVKEPKDTTTIVRVKQEEEEEEEEEKEEEDGERFEDNPTSPDAVEKGDDAFGFDDVQEIPSSPICVEMPNSPESPYNLSERTKEAFLRIPASPRKPSQESGEHCLLSSPVSRGNEAYLKKICLLEERMGRLEAKHKLYRDYIEAIESKAAFAVLTATRGLTPRL